MLRVYILPPLLLAAAALGTGAAPEEHRAAADGAASDAAGQRPGTAAAAPPRPHIVVLLADNVGWANVGFHRPPQVPAREIHTPNLDALAEKGLILDRHYTYKFCSPSRSSFLSGRLPFHVNIYNDDPTMLPGAGVPVNMTMISDKLKTAGYHAHFIGKWHAGMASLSTQTPQGRGFDTTLNYFDSGNNYYDSTTEQNCLDPLTNDTVIAVDLWDTSGPATHLNGSYEERIFGARAVQLIRAHNATTPFFLYYAFHTSCTGYDASGPGGWFDKWSSLQPEPEYYARFPFIDHPDRRANVAMVAFMDEVVGNITHELAAKGMWSNTLLLWSSDNGGAAHLNGGANNYPLRGAYMNNWEGGIRVAALLNGGFLPAHVRGRTLEGFIHEADWYATFCHLAGVDVHDDRAATAGLPQPDSLNVWDLITGVNQTSPRFEWPITPFGEDINRCDTGGDAAFMAEGRYKLIVGSIRQSGWCGQVHPNLTQPWDTFASASVEECTVNSDKVGCLFDVLADPTEHHDLARAMPDKAEEILAKMQQAEHHWFNPDRGQPDPRACTVARETGFYQPYLP